MFQPQFTSELAAGWKAKDHSENQLWQSEINCDKAAIVSQFEQQNIHLQQIL